MLPAATRLLHTYVRVLLRELLYKRRHGVGWNTVLFDVRRAVGHYLELLNKHHSAVVGFGGGVDAQHIRGIGRGGRTRWGSGREGLLRWGLAGVHRRNEGGGGGAAERVGSV